MIQFNLLPDIKQEFIQAKRTKHIVMVSSFAVASVAVSILVLLFLGVSVFQKKHLNDLSKRIDEASNQIKSTPDLDKILTIQNQLNNLDSLHSQKPLSSRFFTFANQITPKTVTISSSTLDFTAKTISFTGSAPDLSTINKFVDTIKFTKYKYPQLDDKGQPVLDSNGNPTFVTANAFSSVVLTSSALTTDATTKSVKANYQIDFAFDATLFDITKDIKLVVPQQVTTRSETEKPTLYQTNNSSTQSSN